MLFSTLPNVYAPIFLLFCLKSEVDNVYTVCVNVEVVAFRLVERSLPQLLERIDVPFESAALKLLAGDIEDTDLLSGEGVEGCVAFCHDKPAIVGDHHGLEAEVAVVVHHQRDVGQGVVFPFPGGAEVGDALLAHLHDEAGGLGQVVVILLDDVMEDVLILCFKLGWKTVAVAYTIEPFFCSQPFSLLWLSFVERE